jgi:hypothetical protein
MSGITYFRCTREVGGHPVVEIGFFDHTRETCVVKMDATMKPMTWPKYTGQYPPRDFEPTSQARVAEVWAEAMRQFIPAFLLKPVVEILARANHTHTCAECGGGFTPLHTKAIYCTPGCRQKAFRSRSGGKP